MDQKRTSKKTKKKSLWLKVSIAVILLLVLSVGGYAYSIYNNAKTTLNDKMHEPVKAIDTKKTKVKIKDAEVLNVLLLGVDERENDKGRSDAMMVLTLDPKNDKMQLVSIPRDTRTEIVGKGFEDKINHAYAFGGSDMAVATVENFLNIDLDYYVRMNMEGLEEVVNQLGSITVYNDIAWDDGKYEFGFGPTDMDGDKTMHFVRMRKQDPDGDFGRTKRQRQVIQGIVNKGASVSSVTKINGMIDVLGNNMATNMDFSDMKNMLSQYKNTRKNFTDYQMKGTGAKLDGIYYLIVADEEVEKVHGMITGVESGI
ncbi:LCP family glycopolymer transferase [Virgibacillus halodenitrificans]|uniref:LCP family glycopolymer transferase n=1 Tax=Virgibacillus halodenitrificans TaxID=1482 RepID=UPI00045CB31F|nr:LCP family protein [Virgibacillus halodenitrificans]MEC2158320.1 LCP family protein [Virgibacillus halodenitrificans]CDQ31060.1 Membrane-bound protein LytR [Virgibacillus halodenitrificans]